MDNAAVTSTPELTVVKSSYLVVDRKMDEAFLMKDPRNLSRLQRLTVDDSGNKTYVIENDRGYPALVTYSTHGSAVNHDKAVIEDNPNQYQLPRAVETSSVTTKRSVVVLPKPSCCSHTETESKKPQPGTSCHKCDPNLFLQSKIKSFRISHNGGRYRLNSHDITISVPPSATIGNTYIDMEVGVMLNGPFIFPPNVRPISPILWICIHNKPVLCKPIEITLPHFIGKLCAND